jgi:hypothetical protein
VGSQQAHWTGLIKQLSFLSSHYLQPPLFFCITSNLCTTNARPATNEKGKPLFHSENYGKVYTAMNASFHRIESKPYTIKAMHSIHAVPFPHPIFSK